MNRYFVLTALAVTILTCQALPAQDKKSFGGSGTKAELQEETTFTANPPGPDMQFVYIGVGLSPENGPKGAHQLLKGKDGGFLIARGGDRYAARKLTFAKESPDWWYYDIDDFKVNGEKVQIRFARKANSQGQYPIHVRQAPAEGQTPVWYDFDRAARGTPLEK